MISESLLLIASPEDADKHHASLSPTSTTTKLPKLADGDSEDRYVI